MKQNYVTMTKLKKFDDNNVEHDTEKKFLNPIGIWVENKTIY